MINYKLTPRFNDTDALGHINNSSFSIWFEEARRPIFQLFVPDLDPKKWNLILARIEIDYLAQAYYQKDIMIQTSVEKIGNSSFVLIQEAIQENIVTAKSKSVLVHYDYLTKKSAHIPDHLRESLLKI
jgi:acyl-CoA thioester hydrolase